MMNTTSTISEKEQERPQRLNFSNPAQREVHIQTFLAWLPPILQTAPGIDWHRLPSQAMGYLIRNITNDPYVVSITLAIGCSQDAMKRYTLLTKCRHLTRLLRLLHEQCDLHELAQLSERSIWDQLVAARMITGGELSLLTSYDSLSSIHLRSFFEGLTERQRLIWKPYMLPLLPVGFIEHQGKRKAVREASMQRRKEQSDVLIPLLPLLVEIVQLRKQAMERLLKEFRRYRDRAVKGEIALPYHFVYTDRVFTVAEDASTLAEVQLIEQEISLPLTLWDRSSWIQEYADQYSDDTYRAWELQKGAYAPERNVPFLQFTGNPKALLWFGPLVANGRLGDPPPGCSRSGYLVVRRPGLLTPSIQEGRWLTFARRAVEDALLFEPESLYRGVLYAGALAALSLTNGSRISELLQVSADRFETLVVDELKDQQPTGHKMGILVQSLLPKGFQQESDRQFFLIGEVAARLLTEIGQLLEMTHGGTIPIVHPYENAKAEDLHPEPYLFQWDASSDGRFGLLTYGDVGHLLGFLFYGLTLTTKSGKPIRVATHLLRHVLATHARTVQNVPAEAIAFLLHHRVHLSDSTRMVTISEATAYYSRMPLEKLLALLFDAQSAISSRKHSYVPVPPPHTLEQMDDALRRVFEQWGMIGPTVLGYCSAGLCVRPNNRALCLGCRYLVPHYSNLHNARVWRKFHVLQAQLHDAHGHHRDAQQARQMIQYLDDIIRIMEIQIRTRQDGGYLPFADTLLQTSDEEEIRDDHI